MKSKAIYNNLKIIYANWRIKLKFTVKIQISWDICNNSTYKIKNSIFFSKTVILYNLEENFHQIFSSLTN